MRKIFLLLLCALSFSTADAALAIGKTSAVTAVSGASTNLTWSGGGSTAAGSIIVVATVGCHASGYDGAAEDGVNSPTTYTKRSTGTFNTCRAMLSFYENSVPISSVTQYHDQGSGSTGYIRAFEITGALTASAEDAANSSTGDASSTDGSISLTTTTADTIVVSLLGVKNTDSALAITDPASYTNLGRQQDGTVGAFSLDYRILSSAGAQTVSYTHDNATGNWGVSAVAFKAASGASGLLLRRRRN